MKDPYLTNDTQLFILFYPSGFLNYKHHSHPKIREEKTKQRID